MLLLLFWNFAVYDLGTKEPKDSESWNFYWEGLTLFCSLSQKNIVNDRRFHEKKEQN